MVKQSTSAEANAAEHLPELPISLEKVCYLIMRAREFDAKDVTTEPDPGSNASDDRMIAVLEDHPDDPAAREARSFIAALNVDEQVALVALAWLGRGDGSIAEWSDLLNQARAAHNERTAQYLLGMPLIADFLAEGLDQFGLACAE